MNENTQDPTLITGGTGKIGRRVQAPGGARAAGEIGSRSADPPFDWEDRGTWAAALEGAAGLYVSYYPDLAVPGSGEAVSALAALAREAGVQRLVLLSGRGEKGAQDAEVLVREAFPAATVVRCSWFNQNFDEGQLVEPVLSGELALPVDASTVEPFVDDDIADVAAAALTEVGHAGEIYELTGPELLTFGHAAERISAASGRTVRFVPISHEDFSAGMSAQELPDDVTWLLDYVFTEVLDGRNASLTRWTQQRRPSCGSATGASGLHGTTSARWPPWRAPARSLLGSPDLDETWPCPVSPGRERPPRPHRRGSQPAPGRAAPAS